MKNVCRKQENIRKSWNKNKYFSENGNVLQKVGWKWKQKSGGKLNTFKVKERTGSSQSVEWCVFSRRSQNLNWTGMGRRRRLHGHEKRTTSAEEEERREQNRALGTRHSRGIPLLAVPLVRGRHTSTARSQK